MKIIKCFCQFVYTHCLTTNHILCIIAFIFIIVQPFPAISLFNILKPTLGSMAHNVPAVCDVLPARIRACVARPGLAKCAGTTAWEWSVAE
jgi:hypothetical protein